MSQFADRKATLLDRMVWDIPDFIVMGINRVIEDTGISKPCKVCHADSGEMCVTPTGRERSVTHTERTQEES
jgi:hypothetical protein